MALTRADHYPIDSNWVVAVKGKRLGGEGRRWLVELVKRAWPGRTAVRWFGMWQVIGWCRLGTMQWLNGFLSVGLMACATGKPVGQGAEAAEASARTGAVGLRYPEALIEQRADPWIWKHADGWYYFTATVPEYDRIELRRARTIAGLREAAPKVIWRRHERGPMSWHVWAPELHFIDGRWYAYFAAGRAEAIWDIRIYVLENASSNPLEGGWIEKG